MSAKTRSKRRTGEEEGRRRKEGRRRTSYIKSNNPHLTGGEQSVQTTNKQTTRTTNHQTKRNLKQNKQQTQLMFWFVTS